MTLDKVTRQAIQSTIQRSIMDAMEVYNEKWLSAAELCTEIGFFTPQWMKEYGASLPRRKGIVTGRDGEEHETHFRYPKYKILRMIDNGEVMKLRVPDVKDLLKVV